MSDVESTDSGGGVKSAVAKVTLPTLTAMVVGSMIGAGVFSLPARFGVATGVIGAVVAWTIAGLGMLMLAFVFQTLAVRKPELDAGVFAGQLLTPSGTLVAPFTVVVAFVVVPCPGQFIITSIAVW